MIGEIERDKITKLNSMKGEIERRQKLIENSDEINEQKNIKILKDLR